MIDRRSFIATGLAAACISDAGQAAARVPAMPPGQLWQAFRERFIQSDGRVIDHGAEARSTSEGQAYALFHALVIGDREAFLRLLEWTTNNLCDGQLGSRLPAWSWGRDVDGRWHVLDQNNATDADLLIAYCLAEAPASFPGIDRGRELAGLMSRIIEGCLRETQAFGPVLTPAARGFEQGSRLRLNPSYLMRPLLLRLAEAQPQGPWLELDRSAAGLLRAGAQPHGIARDWMEVDRSDPDGRVRGDPLGSYDAIRVYLWSGLAGDRATSRAYRGFLHHVRDGRVPERIDANRAEASAPGPVPLSAALLPWLHVLGAEREFKLHRDRVLAHLAGDHLLQRTGYYEANLVLFAEAWRQGRYRFSDTGRLVLDRDQ